MRGAAAVMTMVLLVAHPALAHSFEIAQVAIDPVDSRRIALRYTGNGTGLFYTNDAGNRWRYLCAAATQPSEPIASLGALGRMAITREGTAFVGTFGGLLHDDGHACSWMSEALFEDERVTDVTRHPTDPDVLFAVTSSSGGTDDGLYQRDGSGSWLAFGAREPIVIERLLVADLGADALRYYELGRRGVWCEDTLCEDSLGCCASEPSSEPPTCRPAGGMCEQGLATASPNYVVRVSDDDGETWTEHSLGPTRAPFVLDAVDPSKPDRLVGAMRYSAAAQDQREDVIVVSDDRGASFTEYASVGLYGGAAFAPDGRLWLGGTRNMDTADSTGGLYYAETLDAARPPALLDAMDVGCIEYVPDADKLFVCQRFEAGLVDLDGSDYERRFAFDEVDAFAECPEVDVARACEPQFVDYCSCHFFPGAPICCESQEVRALAARQCSDLVAECPATDAGVEDEDAGEADDAGDAAHGGPSAAQPIGETSACGCRLPAGADPDGIAPLLLLGVALALQRMRRHR